MQTHTVNIIDYIFYQFLISWWTIKMVLAFMEISGINYISFVQTLSYQEEAIFFSVWFTQVKNKILCVPTGIFSFICLSKYLAQHCLHFSYLFIIFGSNLHKQPKTPSLLFFFCICNWLYISNGINCCFHFACKLSEGLFSYKLLLIVCKVSKESITTSIY